MRRMCGGVLVVLAVIVVFGGLFASPTHAAPLAAPSGETAFFANAACADPPCTSSKIMALRGHKTVTIKVTGTATVDVYCLPLTGTTAISMLQVSGADTQDEAEFDAACVELYATTSACTPTCHVTAGAVITAGN